MTLYDRGTPRSGSLIVPATSPYVVTLSRPVLRGTMLINGFTEVENSPREDQYSINYTGNGQEITFDEVNANNVLSYAYEDYGSDINAADINIAMGRLSVIVNLGINETQTVFHNLNKVR